MKHEIAQNWWRKPTTTICSFSAFLLILCSIRQNQGLADHHHQHTGTVKERAIKTGWSSNQWYEVPRWQEKQRKCYLMTRSYWLLRRRFIGFKGHCICLTAFAIAAKWDKGCDHLPFDRILLDAKSFLLLFQRWFLLYLNTRPPPLLLLGSLSFTSKTGTREPRMICLVPAAAVFRSFD